MYVPNTSIGKVLFISRAYPWSKKTDEWLRNYYCILGRISARWGISKQVTALGKLCSSTTLRKCLPSFKLGNSASKLKLPQNCNIVNINSNIPIHRIYPVWKTILTIWKIWKQDKFKNHNFSTVEWIGRNLEVQSKLIFKNRNFQSHPWIGKFWEVQQEQH